MYNLLTKKGKYFLQHSLTKNEWSYDKLTEKTERKRDKLVYFVHSEFIF